MHRGAFSAYPLRFRTDVRWAVLCQLPAGLRPGLPPQVGPIAFGPSRLRRTMDLLLVLGTGWRLAELA
jgi:hypothetical protein